MRCLIVRCVWLVASAACLAVLPARAEPIASQTLAVGAEMPHFTAHRINPEATGALATRELPAGRPVVFSFVASYCAPCRAEVPRLSALARANPRWQVVVVVLDRDAEGLAAARRWLFDEAGVTLPVVRDRFSLIARRFGVTTLPHVVAFDGARRLVWRGIGAETADLTPLAAALSAGGTAP